MQRVSVVIPCFNSGATVRQTVESVQAQTWGDTEIVVVDDGSTDIATIAVLDSLSGVRLVRQENAGLPAARNAGFAAATGEYVLPLDADDWLEPDAIAELIQALEESQDASFAYSQIWLEGEAKGVLAKSYNFFEQLFLNQMPYSNLMRRSLWQEIGGYDETMRRGYEDWEFNIRLGASGHCGVAVPRPLFHYRVASTGMLLARSNQLHGELWSAIQRKNAAIYRLSNLLKLWKEWRLKPSTYPLWLYFFWLSIHRILPCKIFAFLFRTLRKHSHSRRVSKRVIDGFGEEWTRFDQQKLTAEELHKIFDDYFAIFPWGDLPEGAKGADIGCGSGRWAGVAAPLVGWLTCIDASSAALTVARKNLAGCSNVDFKQASVSDLPFTDGELDFAYSLGVLHHVYDPEGALRRIARTLRPGGFFLMYLYYAFDNRPPWFKMLWRITDLARRLISYLPRIPRFLVCEVIAAIVYWPLARLAAWCRWMSLPTKNLPLAYYADKSFYVMRTDALDRFGTSLKNRYTRNEIASLLSDAGFEKISFSDKAPYWCALAIKSDDALNSPTQAS